MYMYVELRYIYFDVWRVRCFSMGVMEGVVGVMR